MNNQEIAQQFENDWKNLVKALANLKTSREFQSNWQRFMVGVSKLKSAVQTTKPSQENDNLNQSFRSKFFS
jgi:hypothetical protein